MADVMSKAMLKNKYGNEQVFVIPYMLTTDIPDLFTAGNISNNNLCTFEGKGHFVFRCDAEYNNSVQQIIPYIAVLSDDLKRIYVSERIAGEERLQKKLSFFGGHINPCDSAAGNSLVLNAAERELKEEVALNNRTVLMPVGTVRDMASSTPDHIGLVFSTTAKSAKIKEVEGMNGRWMTFDQVITDYTKFEGWARYIIDYVFKSGTKDFSSIHC